MRNHYFLKKPQRSAINFSYLLISLFFSSCSGKNDTTPGDNSMRVVSLAPNVTEIVCALGGGDLLVGRTTACDYPPEIQNVPVMGGFGRPSLELLVNAGPDIVLEVDMEDKALADAIDRIGLKREKIKCARLEDIPEAIKSIGALINRNKEADTLAKAFGRRMSEHLVQAGDTTENDTEKPSMFVEIWGDPLMTVGRKSFVSELVRAAGARNTGDAIDREYFTTDPEWVVQSDPDIIICLYMTETGSARDLASKRTGWTSVKAVRNGHVYDGFDNNLLLRPGPRVVEGIDLLKRCVEKWRDDKSTF